MPICLTIEPRDACGRPLPVRCQLRVTRDNQLEAKGVCEANAPRVDLQVATPHVVYAVALSASDFGNSARFVPVQEEPETVVMFCLAAAKRVTPLLPAYAELPDELRAVLDRSEGLDLEAEREPSRTQQSSRGLPSRSVGAARPLPERGDRAVRDGERRWQRLNEEAKAGLLNLFAKMGSITVSIARRSTWSYVDRLQRVQRDRILAIVDPNLKRDTEESPLFKAPFELLPIFHRPPKNFSRAGSWKSSEPYGNLQLTFFSSHEDHQEIWIDADVDDAAGVEHAEQFARNESRKVFRFLFGRLIPGLPEGTSHPYDIHQIVVRYQEAQGDAAGAILDYRPCYRVRVNGTPADYLIPQHVTP